MTLRVMGCTWTDSSSLKAGMGRERISMVKNVERAGIAGEGTLGQYANERYVLREDHQTVTLGHLRQQSKLLGSMLRFGVLTHYVKSALWPLSSSGLCICGMRAITSQHTAEDHFISSKQLCSSG